MSSGNSILTRLYIVVGFLFLFGIVVFSKMMHIMYVEGDDLVRNAEKSILKVKKIPARRGNIYSENNDLLAITLTKYDIRLDLNTIDKKLFNQNIKALADSLSKLTNTKSSKYYLKKIKRARRKRNGYFLLKRNLDYPDYSRIIKFPILNKGKHRGGLIVEQKIKRINPLGEILSRTIGYDDHRGRNGLEGAYSPYLRGKSGKQLKQRISNNVWKPIDDPNRRDPEDGMDIVTTIDVGIQGIAHKSLLGSLEKFEADHGCAIVMEVATGKVKAMVNLARGKTGKYYEKRNYAIFESSEPGSTFKLVSLMVAMEDGVIDTTSTVDTQGGKVKFYNRYIRDSHHGGYGVITAKRVLELSSNVGTSKLIWKHYKDNPKKFVDKIYKWGLADKLNIDLKGEGAPMIPHPNNKKSWSGLALPWMSYGYGIHLTPLQILNFYNTVANNGKMMKPIFVSKIMSRGKVVKEILPSVINSSICSKSTIGKAKKMLEGVVKRGTAKNIYTDKFSMAGKTGTAQLSYWKKGVREYAASFAGYFPAENPKYSCIVVVQKPNTKKGYYGNIVAAPVFKDIAQKIYVNNPLTNENIVIDKNIVIKKINSSKTIKYKKPFMPNLIGIPIMEAVVFLENKGKKVVYNGVGLVTKQSVKGGTDINKISVVKLDSN